MSANSFGHYFKISTFGESHGEALGVVIDGCPAGVSFNYELLIKNLQRRRPGLQSGTSARNEQDKPEILSGIFQGLTLGTPIAMIVRNQDARSADYESIKSDSRIGHADDVWKNKFGHTDHRGGGRSSGRETVARVMAGSVAETLVKKICPEVIIKSFSKRIGPYEADTPENLENLDVEKFPLSFPSEKAEEIKNFLEEAKKNGQSYGGTAEVHVIYPPLNLGQPVFHKLKSDFAAAVMSIGATTAFEFGEGVQSASAKGTDFHSIQDNACYGGIRGGISTGKNIQFRVHFKPTSSITDVAKKGRHDPCIVPRALPVLESMIWLVLADHILWSRIDRV